MTELWLKFTDEKGEAKRVLVETEKFAVGRHSENDLSVASGKLSREHLKIERFGDVFVVSDCNSSNGTTLNGAKLDEPVALKNGDVLNLGGGLEIEIEVISDAPNADVSGANAEEVSPDEVENDAQISAATSAQSVSASSGGGSIPTFFFFLAPVFGIVVLVMVGGIFFAFCGKDEPEIVERNNSFIYSTERNNKSNKNENSSNADKTPTPLKSPANSTDNTSAASPTPVTISGETAKVKQNAADFMRRIAKSDANPFLTQEQAEKVGEKIKSLKNSSGFVENLKAVKKDASQFESMAATKDLKPQFLAAAALTKLGGGSNPTGTAQTMLPVLNELKIALDNTLADDNLMIIAAYERGAAGKPRDLRNTLEALAKKSQSVSPREIRTIWFLKENGKISDAEFEFALRFLAIGAIMQNPKDFDINTEPVIF
jgi:pSer/pThr/pTyr-binding forkhead associated (FHA) protein